MRFFVLLVILGLIFRAGAAFGRWREKRSRHATTGALLRTLAMREVERTAEKVSVPDASKE